MAATTQIIREHCPHLPLQRRSRLQNGVADRLGGLQTGRICASTEIHMPCATSKVSINGISRHEQGKEQDETRSGSPLNLGKGSGSWRRKYDLNNEPIDIKVRAHTTRNATALVERVALVEGPGEDAHIPRKAEVVQVPIHHFGAAHASWTHVLTKSTLARTRTEVFRCTPLVWLGRGRPLGLRASHAQERVGRGGPRRSSH